MTTSQTVIRTSAPGKLMLFGEHAVLYGYPCIVAAVTPRAHVELRPRSDTTLRLQSELGVYEATLETLTVAPPFTFVLEAVRRSAATSGFELEIACDFPPDVGLGSSAAVTVAVVAALMTLTNGETPGCDDVFNEALAVVRAVQGTGSGADLAASTYGGVLRMKSGGESLHKLHCHPQILAAYSGAKEKTATVIDRVRKARAENLERFDRIFAEIGDCVVEAEAALMSEDWERVGELMARNQDLMAKMGVSNSVLETIISTLLNDPGVFGAKISGSGLGDSVWGLGTLENDEGVQLLELELDSNGLIVC